MTLPNTKLNSRYFFRDLRRSDAKLHAREKTQEKRHRFHLKAWHLFLLLIPLLFISANLLRRDHLKMLELKSAVLAADVSGDEAALQSALTDLQTFTYGNIVINIVDKNGGYDVYFGTGGFYLENQYYRKTAALIAEAEANLGNDENPNGNVFAKANEVCRPQAIANGWAWTDTPYLNCMTGEIAKYQTADDALEDKTVALPSTALYRYNFASPVWAPTATGFALLGCAILILGIFLKLLGWLFLHIAYLFLRNPR